MSAVASVKDFVSSFMLTELLKVARHHGFHLRTPGGVEELVALLLGEDVGQERRGQGGGRHGQRVG